MDKSRRSSERQPGEGVSFFFYFYSQIPKARLSQAQVPSLAVFFVTHKQGI